MLNVSTCEIIPKKYFIVANSDLIWLYWENFCHIMNCFKTVQWNSVITNSVVSEHSVILNKFLSHIVHFNVQNNSVITNKNGQSRAVRFVITKFDRISLNNPRLTRFVCPQYQMTKRYYGNVVNFLITAHCFLYIYFVYTLTSN
jgi:hypothetical protein